MTKATWWWISCGLSVVLVVLLAWQWSRVTENYDPDDNQVTDARSVEAVLDTHKGARRGAEPIRVPTGIFLQSLKFTSGTDVHLTGYVWQTYEKGTHDGIARGFILPEAVHSTQKPSYRHVGGEGREVIGWHFEATLRQNFDYSKYPLDHKTVWVRLWHNEPHKNVVLVPDLAAYESTGSDDAFGIDGQIALAGWDIDETFFDYQYESYDTHFGIAELPTSGGALELYFNVVIHREFLDAFVVNLVPLGVCAALLFAMMLTVTVDRKLSRRLGFNTTAVVGTCSALFFVIMLAHIQLRRTLSGSGIVYIEIFYFLMYAVILGVVANTYMFSMDKPIRLVQHRDNLIPKITYWPVILAAMNAITFATF